jgi:hypothetical protein
MLRSLAVVAAVVIVLVLLNYRAPQDPIREIDPAPIAADVAAVAPFPVLLPTQEGWRATAARYEPTPESDGQPVWFAGGVQGTDGPFAGVVQAQQVTPDLLAEQTRSGEPVGASSVDGQQWQRYEAGSNRSLVRTDAAGVTITTGTGSWPELEAFTASLEPVQPS